MWLLCFSSSLDRWKETSKGRIYLSIPFHKHSEEEHGNDDDDAQEEDSDLIASRDGSFKYRLYCISFISLSIRESKGMLINE